MLYRWAVSRAQAQQMAGKSMRCFWATSWSQALRLTNRWVVSVDFFTSDNLVKLPIRLIKQNIVRKEQYYFPVFYHVEYYFICVWLAYDCLICTCCSIRDQGGLKKPLLYYACLYNFNLKKRKLRARYNSILNILIVNKVLDALQVTAFAPAFTGCGSIPVEKLTRVEFDNNSKKTEQFCVDQVRKLL